MKKKGLITIWLAAFWCVLLLAALGGVTYAWFTFDPYTRVEPLSSTIGPGETTLLMATDPAGEFRAQCALPQSVSTGLRPVSTADLGRFYRAYSQNRQGISVEYADVTDQMEEDVIHGVLYLKSLTDNCKVYFYLPGMSFGQDSQALAALRLGIRFTTERGVNTYIFSLNGIGDTQPATGRLTTPQKGVVVSSIGGERSAVFVEDPARELQAFAAVLDSQSPQLPKAGEQELCTLSAQEVATLEYWLYLEGCDENCVNEVQAREVSLQLSFAGVTLKE